MQILCLGGADKLYIVTLNKCKKKYKTLLNINNLKHQWIKTYQKSALILYSNTNAERVCDQNFGARRRWRGQDDHPD